WTITSAPYQTQNNVRVYVGESDQETLTHYLNFDHTTLTTANLTAEHIRGALTDIFDGAGSDWSVSGSDNEVIFTNNSDVQLDAPAFDDDDFNEYSKAFVEIEITDISSVATATDWGVMLEIDGQEYWFEDNIIAGDPTDIIAQALVNSAIWTNVGGVFGDSTTFPSVFDITQDYDSVIITKKTDGTILPATLSLFSQTPSYNQTNFTFGRYSVLEPQSHILTFTILPDNITANIDCEPIYVGDFTANQSAQCIWDELDRISDITNNFTLSYLNNVLTFTAKNYGEKLITISAQPIYLSTSRNIVASGSIEVIAPDFDFTLTNHQYGEITTPLFT
ncbi:MAG TPA: hypothetical protein PK612_05290, partial [Bacilli bacterium]|nr:hypothetical protein [Bacilli bacterium]